VRELRDTVERLALFPNVGREAFAALLTQGPAGRGALNTLFQMTLRPARNVIVEQFEKTYIEAKLKESGGNISKAADLMGISRQFLYRLLDEHGLRP
jgi:DNA-binding NtrC family response regulator